MPDGIPTFEESIMPRSTIKACAKTVLHADTAIQKDALTALAKGSSVFISYLTTHANEIALSKKRKTIMPSDVVEALKVIELERFVPDLQAAHERAEAEAKEKRERKKSGASAYTSAELEDLPLSGTANNDDELTQEDEALPAAKRARIENGADAEMTEAQETQEVVEEEPADDEEDDDEDEDDEDEDEEDEGNAEEDDDAAGLQLREEPVDELEDRQRDDYDEALDNGSDSE